MPERLSALTLSVLIRPCFGAWSLCGAGVFVVGLGSMFIAVLRGPNVCLPMGLVRKSASMLLNDRDRGVLDLFPQEVMS